MIFPRLLALLGVFSALCAIDTFHDKFILIGSDAQMPLQVVPYPQSPSLDNILVKVVLPENGEVQKKSPVSVQLKMVNFSLGVTTKNTLFPGLRENPKGQTIRVIIDNNPYLSVGVLSEDSYNADLDMMRKNLSFKLPDLEKGEHVIRVFPVTSFGESIKRQNNFDISTFYIGAKKNTINQDLSKPFITYNEPQGEFRLKSPQEPVLLDFFLSNCTLTREGYKVRLTVDGSVLGNLYQWSPYLLFGLSKGKHTIKLELLDSRDAVVPGDFNSTERTITIK